MRSASAAPSTHLRRRRPGSLVDAVRAACTVAAMTGASSDFSHPRPPRRFTGLLRRSITTALLGAALVVMSPAAAHEGEQPAAPDSTTQSGSVRPAPDSVVEGTPKQVVVTASSIRSLRLLRPDGSVVPAAGPVSITGAGAVLSPPELDPGTYVVEWSTPGLWWTVLHRSVFSVDTRSALLRGSPVTYHSSVPAPLRGVAVLLAIASALLWPRRRHHAMALLASSVLIQLAVLHPSGPIGAALIGSSFSLAAFALVLVLRSRRTSRPAAAAGAATFVAACALVVLNAVNGTLLSSLAWMAASASLVLGAAFTAVLVALNPTPAAPASPAPRQGGALVLARRGAALVSVGAAVALVLQAPGANARLGGADPGEVPVLAACLSDGTTPQRQACLQNLYVAKADSSGVNAALEQLRTDTSARPELLRFCHEVSHAIGRASYRINGSIAKAFEDGFDVCDYGYYHGILEASGEGTDDEEFVRKIPTLCAALATASRTFYGQCVHGIGHAAARRANNDLNRGLGFCDALESSDLPDGVGLEQVRMMCGTGVTMQWFMVAGLRGFENMVPLVAKPVQACEQVLEHWKASCYEYLGNTADANRAFDSLREIAATCNDSAWAKPCFKGVARAAGGLRLPDSERIALCQLARADDAVRECVVMTLFTVATTVEYDLDAVDRICAQLPERFRRAGAECDQMRTIVKETLTGVRDGKGAPGLTL